MSTLQAGRMVTTNVQLVRELGRGAMGSVWLADHLTLRTKVAVKFIAEQLATNDADVLARFTAEATAAAQIKSPHVVQTFDAGIMDDGTPYIVMELLEGETLGARLDRVGRLAIRQVAQILAQVARALDKAHRVGIVHRDIKPDNIFLMPSDDDLHVKILDFGIAKGLHLPASGGVTMPGTLVGTPDYMSREQVMHSQAVDAHTDMWALAVTVYEALTDHLPFTGENVGATCAHIAMGRFVAPSRLRPELPRELDAWFDRAWHTEREARFANAKVMALAFLQHVRVKTDDLEDLLTQTGVFAMPPEVRAALATGGRPDTPRQGVAMPRATPLPAGVQAQAGTPTPRSRSASTSGTLAAGADPERPSGRSSGAAPDSKRPSTPPRSARPSQPAYPRRMSAASSHPSGRTDIAQFPPVASASGSPPASERAPSARPPLPRPPRASAPGPASGRARDSVPAAPIAVAAMASARPPFAPAAPPPVPAASDPTPVAAGGLLAAAAAPPPDLLAPERPASAGTLRGAASSAPEAPSRRRWGVLALVASVLAFGAGVALTLLVVGRSAPAPSASHDGAEVARAPATATAPAAAIVPPPSAPPALGPAAGSGAPTASTPSADATASAPAASSAPAGSSAPPPASTQKPKAPATGWRPPPAKKKPSWL
ncbi:MAG: protein kinase [Myxococcales bacterium]|nr:protein kinase [Myxococcales bacterium]